MKIQNMAICCLALGASFLVPGAQAADVSGQWAWVLQTEGGERNVTTDFQVNGETVTGKWDTTDVKGTFAGDKLTLNFPLTLKQEGISGTLRIEGTLEGDVLRGKWAFEDYNGTYRAERKKTAAAASPIAGSWQCEIETDHEVEAILVITEDGGKLSGKLKTPERELAMLTPKFENGTLTFGLEVGSTTVAFEVKPSGDQITGQWKAGDRSGGLKGKKIRA